MNVKAVFFLKKPLPTSPKERSFQRTKSNKTINLFTEDFKSPFDWFVINCIFTKKEIE